MQSNQSTTSTTTDPDDPIISSSSGRIYLSGHFPDVLVLDSMTLAEIDRIPLEAEKHCRLSLLTNPDESSGWIAVSQGGMWSPSDLVLVYDITTKECVNRLIGASDLGLETITNSSLSTNSIVVSSGEDKILIFDSITGDILCDFQNPPYFTFRISHFPKWNRNCVFVGGIDPYLSQYDLNQERECVRVGIFRGHDSSVHGLSASISHQLLLSGATDQELKCWSFNQFDSSVNSIQLDKRCCSVKYLEDCHLICCGTENEIEIFDIRNLSQRIRKVENGGIGAVYDLDRIETDSSDPFCMSGGNLGVSIWNPISGAVLQEQRVGGTVFGVRFRGFGEMRMKRFQIEDRSERIGYVLFLLKMEVEEEESFTCVRLRKTVKLVAPDEWFLQVFKWMISC